MGSTLAGPVPIVVGAAVAVPLTYAYDIVVRGLSFTTLSLVGALVVFISFLLLNVLELHTSSAVTTEAPCSCGPVVAEGSTMLADSTHQHLAPAPSGPAAASDR